MMKIFYLILSKDEEYLVKLALETLKNYIDWVDIRLVTTPEFAKIFFVDPGNSKEISSGKDCVGSCTKYHQCPTLVFS